MAQQTEALAGGLLAGQEDAEVRRRSNLWRDAWYRLIRNKLAVVGMCGVIFLLFVAAFGPLLAPKERDKVYFGHQQEGPTSEFKLGTDFESRDMLTRLIYGARVTVLV